jgi:uncharacterized integral membrane protein
MVGMSDPASKPAKRAGDKPARAQRSRMVAAGILGAVAALLAAFNLEKVSVDWVVGSWQTPLIVVIAVSMLLGALLDRVLVHRARRRRPAP